MTFASENDVTERLEMPSRCVHSSRTIRHPLQPRKKIIRGGGGAVWWRWAVGEVA